MYGLNPYIFFLCKSATMPTIEKARFNTRLSKEQKATFEYAASIGGFKTLSEFVIFSAQQQANTIIEKKNLILASKKDHEVFFNAITKSPKPNNKLQKAALRYKSLVK